MPRARRAPEDDVGRPALPARRAGPGRAAALARFLDYVQGHDRVWVATRLDIARHWIASAIRPAADTGASAHQLTRAAFVERFGGVFEHSPWVAERAFDTGAPGGRETAEDLHAALSAAMRAGSPEEQRALIAAHPDLAGRLARAGQLTANSTAEQRSAGLDLLSDEERARFTDLNDAYRARFGFPFIMAVKGRRKDEILAAFERRLAHEPAAELATALDEIDRIALLRLRDMLP